MDLIFSCYHSVWSRREFQHVSIIPHASEFSTPLHGLSHVGYFGVYRWPFGLDRRNSTNHAIPGICSVDITLRQVSSPAGT